jgi:ribonuclease HI
MFQETQCNIIDVNTIDRTNLVIGANIWTLFFDGSKSQEGVGVGCLIVDPQGKCSFISCKLEFECTNNTIEYESLVQGLKKNHRSKNQEFKSFW